MMLARVTFTKRTLILFFSVVVMLMAYTGGGVSAQTADKQPSASRTVTVKFTDSPDAGMRSEIAAVLNGNPLRWMPQLNVLVVAVPDQMNLSDAALNERLAQLQARPQIDWAQLDGVVGITAVQEAPATGRLRQETVPPAPVQVNDPDFNNPQRVYAPGLVDLPLAWAYNMGMDATVVAVVDSGVNAAHPDLAGRVLPGYDFVNDDADPTDDHGHGTHVAGIIAATANNGIGSAGLCPHCQILPIKVLNADNVGTWSSVAAGIVYAADQGADIINLSLGGVFIPQVVIDAVDYAVARDVLVVAAAGNGRSSEPFYPAALENVLAVSATRNDDSQWSLSNSGDWIDIAAPGYAIYSTYSDLNNVFGGYTFMSGTSMAAPHVAGLAGLLRSQTPDMPMTALMQALRETAVDLGDPGKDAIFGYGRMDARAALASISTQSTSEPTPPVQEAPVSDDSSDDSAQAHLVYLPALQASGQ